MDSTYHVAGLEKSAEIIVDRWGIPHLYAESVEDLYLAQGFNAARDRLFQIDLWRRRGLGLLAEVFGSAYVERDRAARLFLYRGDLAAEWSAYGFDAERIATRFTAGINAYVDWLESNPDALPPEFQLVGYRPARWAPEDVVRIRSHGLQGNVLSELIRAKLVDVTDARADEFRQPLEPGRPPVESTVPGGDIPDEVLRTYELGTVGAYGATTYEDVSSGAGSNNWAVAAHRTTTGRPLLASDPHRSFSTPSLRYISHLSAPGFDVIGAGEPALPGVTAGHNGTAAFGFTIFPIDAQDLYVYELDPADARRYRHGAGSLEFDTIVEAIPVRAEPARDVELRFTEHGPVLHVDHETGRAYAVRTVWSEPGTAPYFGAIGYLDAKSWPEFRSALDTWGAPGENHLYADVSGTIAWRAAGKAPRRVGYTGLLPASGDGSRDWDGWYPASDFPEVVDPPEGFWATANQFNLPDGFPDDRVFSYEWADPARYQRIVDVLSEKRAFSLDDMTALQTDLVSVATREITGLLDGLSSPELGTAAALRLLGDWDGVEHATSTAAALYHVWLGRHLGPAVARTLLPLAASKLLPGVDNQVLRTILREPAGWFGGSGTEARNALLLSTLGAAYAETLDLLGPDPETWTWGELHRCEPSHPLGHLDPSFDVGSIPTGGSGTTVNAAHYFADDFKLTIGASFRMVVDVGEWDNSVCVNVPGQSGDPRSPHYRDLIEPWRDGAYVPMLYTRAAVEQHAEQRLLLLPAGSDQAE